MDIDEISATLRSKLSGPILFPLTFSTIVVNWKAFFLLFVSKGTAQERISLFEANSSLCTIFLFPALSALALIIGLPYIRWITANLTAQAVKGRRIRDSLTDQAVETNRLEHQAATAKLRIEIARRNKEADEITETIGNADLREVTEGALTETATHNTNTTSTSGRAAIDGYTWLINQSSKTLDEAETRAFSEAKKLLIIVYDKKAMSGGHIRHAAGYFFEFQETRNLINKNFVVFLAERGQVKALLSSLKVSIERPVYFLKDFNNKNIDNGRLSGNPDEGLKKVRNWATLI